MMIASLMAMGMAAQNCRRIGDHAQVTFKPAVARPGDRLKLGFTYRDGPDGDKPVPLQCVEKLRVRGRAALERNYVMRITNDAQAGSVVRAVVLIGGREIYADIVVVGRDQQVLTGTWHPVSMQNCRGRALGELAFSAEGGFSYTFRSEMMETRTSGGGRYTWDGASGRLTLNGRAGVARLADGGLSVTGFDLDPGEPMPVPPPGSPQPSSRPACHILLRSS